MLPCMTIVILNILVAVKLQRSAEKFGVQKVLSNGTCDSRRQGGNHFKLFKPVSNHRYYFLSDLEISIYLAKIQIDRKLSAHVLKSQIIIF